MLQPHISMVLADLASTSTMSCQQFRRTVPGQATPCIALSATVVAYGTFIDNG